MLGINMPQKVVHVSKALIVHHRMKLLSEPVSMNQEDRVFVFDYLSLHRL